MVDRQVWGEDGVKTYERFYFCSEARLIIMAYLDAIVSPYENGSCFVSND
jgi:hypothetical protein